IGCDGGLYESFDRAENWNFKANLPVTQFYRVSADDALPFYSVYGGTQDNFSLGGPARTTDAKGIANADWYVTQGGDGFRSIPDPKDPNTIYSESQNGGLVRFDVVVRQHRLAGRVALAGGADLRRHRRRADSGHRGRRRALAEDRSHRRRARHDLRFPSRGLAARRQRCLRRLRQSQDWRLQ